MKRLTKVLSVILAAALTISCMPMSALAEGINAETEPAVVIEEGDGVEPEVTETEETSDIIEDEEVEVTENPEEDSEAEEESAEGEESEHVEELPSETLQIDEEPVEVEEETVSEEAKETYYVSGNYTYTVNDNNTAKITKYSGTYGTVNLPSTIDGHTVTIIGEGAFKGHTEIQNLFFSEKIWVIEKEAFYGCTNLAMINLPSGFRSFGDSAFSGCSGLISVKLNDDLFYIGQEVFAGCSSLTSITVPSSVTTIGAGAFSGCSKLESITLPYIGVSRSGSGSDILFGYIFGTKSYTGGTPVLQHYTNVSSVTYYIPKTLRNVTITDATYIPYGAFDNCASLTSITVKGSAKTIGDYAFSSCAEATSISFPDDAETIGAYAFNHCPNLKSITIPSGVTSIGEAAFSNCASLTSVTIPDGVTSIGKLVFYYCSGLTSIKLPSGIKSIGDRTFYGCKNLTGITIPSKVTTIGDGAFRDCTALKTIILNCSPSTVVSGAFYNVTAEVACSDGNIIRSYTDTGSGKLTFVSPPKANILTYTGSAQKLVTAESATNIKRLYSLDNKTYSASIPTATNAGNYTVYYKAVGADNCNNTEPQIIPVTISKAAAAVTAPTAKTLAYTGKNQELINAGKTSGGTVKYSLTKNGTYKTTIPTGKAIGSYKVYYKVDGGTNYKSTTAKYITVKIIPKTVSITSLINSKSKTLTVKWKKNSSVTGYQIQYSTKSKFTSAKTVTITKNTTLTKDLTKLTKGKTYYVRIRTYKTVSKVKYYSTWSTSKKLKVSK